jgi:non-haem Fe2+, alpha-ketoglutarate-dependent halogenase
MPKLLTEDQIRAYHRDGCVFPIPLLGPAEAAEIRGKFEALETTIGGEAQQRYRIKAHLPFPWLNDLIRHPRLLDAIEDLMGRNILCWGSSFFTKDAHDPRFVSWHQDSTYYGLKPAETVTAWVAFTDSKVESGCMRVIRRTHKLGQLRHEETYDSDNLLSRGQTIAQVDESSAVDIVLQAGEFSIHSEFVIHGSNPNRSDDRRLGFSIHYIPPHVRQTLFDGATAAAVRGRDTHGFWRPDPQPKVDFDAECQAALDRAFQQYKSVKQHA